MNDLPPGSTPGQSPDPDATPTSALPATQGGDPAGQPTSRTGEAPTKQRLRDRLWSFRAVIAVALASVIIGGLGGAALATVSNGDEGRFGPGPNRFQRGGPGVPPGWMDGRRRDRMKQWHQRRWQGQRQWRQENPGLPNRPPPRSRVPSPPTPTPSG